MWPSNLFVSPCALSKQGTSNSSYQAYQAYLPPKDERREEISNIESKKNLSPHPYIYTKTKKKSISINRTILKPLSCLLFPRHFHSFFLFQRTYHSFFFSFPPSSRLLYFHSLKFILCSCYVHVRFPFFLSPHMYLVNIARDEMRRDETR